MHLVEIPVTPAWPAAELKARVVPQPLVSDEAGCNVHAESIDAAVEPEPHDVVDRVADLVVSPVEVGLFRQEVMEVVLAGLLVESPRAADALEDRAPVVGRPSAARIGPDVEVALGIGARGPCREEPRMLVRGVTRDQVDDDPDVAAVGFRQEVIELGQISESRIDVAVVRDVVPEVGHRRAIERREPDRVDAERPRCAVVQVIQTRRDAREVADAVAVRVLERARIDLIEDAFSPPLTAHAPIVPISLVS